MTTARQALLRKFSSLRNGAIASNRLHRFKGQRQRMTLRLAAELAQDLRILKVALGVDMNSLCEEVLKAAVAQRLQEVRARSQPGEWDVIVRCAHASR